MTIQTKNLYEKDFNLWLSTTAELLRSGKFDLVDLENLIEELEDMGNSQKDSLESNLRILLMHLLKWKFQHSKRTNSWRSSIAEHSYRINKAFKKSPSLSRYFDDVFEECYQDARVIASIETGLAEETFPLECQFTKEDILNPKYLPQDL